MEHQHSTLCACSEKQRIDLIWNIVVAGNNGDRPLGERVSALEKENEDEDMASERNQKRGDSKVSLANWVTAVLALIVLIYQVTRDTRASSTPPAQEDTQKQLIQQIQQLKQQLNEHEQKQERRQR